MAYQYINQKYRHAQKTFSYYNYYYFKITKNENIMKKQ